MNPQERAMLIWSVFFVISGLVFMIAFFSYPLTGTLVTTAYILLYLGLSTIFVMVFREISSLREETVSGMREKKDEMEEVVKALKNKYFRKKIDDESYRKMAQDYEKLITELEVKIARHDRKK
jgi:membrane protein implicated in regulation of membrane protease activity